MRNYVYIHVCCVNNWKQVLENLYFHIKTSGLYDVVESIKCNILCKSETKEDVEMYFSELLLADAKLQLLGITCDISLYETPTINLLHKHAIETDGDDGFNVLYLHTKGVTRSSDNVNDWVKYLIYFNITKYKMCIDQLSDHDTVGINLIDAPATHYSGNFWWARSKHLKNLKRCVHKHYNSPEFWLTEEKNGKFLSLWNSNINHYNERYEECNYIKN